MTTERGWFSFFILLALTLNFGFVMGEIDNPQHHHIWEFALAFVVSLIATVLKFGDRTALGSVFLATSLVADFHMLIGIVIWTRFFVFNGTEVLDGQTMAAVVSMASGALVANFASVTLLIYETITLRR